MTYPKETPGSCATSAGGQMMGRNELPPYNAQAADPSSVSSIDNVAADRKRENRRRSWRPALSEGARYAAATDGGDAEDWQKQFDTEDGINREAVAKALGGEVIGRCRIAAPSPGRWADDRSLIVDVYDNGGFSIYTCQGPRWRAKNKVHAALGTVPKPEPDPAEKAERTAKAMALWGEAIPASGTMAEAYLRGRGITIPLPPTLRFHPRLWHVHTSQAFAGMVALVTRADEPVAIHQTFLCDGKKAPVDPERLALGPTKGGIINLTDGDGPLLLGEGIETVLSAAQESKRPSASGLNARGVIGAVLPEAVRDVVLLIDNDAAGEEVVRNAPRKLQREGRIARIVRPPADYNDFNDVVMGKKK